jgi:hypothetical protein
VILLEAGQRLGKLRFESLKLRSQDAELDPADFCYGYCIRLPIVGIGFSLFPF